MSNPQPQPPLRLTLTSASPSSPPPPTPPPPTVTIVLTVTNTSQVTSYTLFVWSSPLDPLAVQLGLLSATTIGDNRDPAPLPTQPIMLKRATPPASDAYLTLAPGESASHEAVLRPPAIDTSGLRAGDTVRVRWAGPGRERGAVVVWQGRKEDLTPGQLDSWHGLSDGTMAWVPDEDTAAVDVLVT